MFRGSLLLSLLILLVVPAGSAVALGLGDIHLASGLNQPLSADIELLSTSHEELARLTVALASRDTFQHLGVDRPAFLSSVTFRVIEDGAGHATLRVRSSETFTEPFVDLVVDLGWPGGKLVRDYTLLLDPPGSATPTTPLEAGSATTNPGAASAHVATHPASAGPAASPAPVTSRGGAGVPTAAGAPQSYTVVAGDTLDRIVRHLGARTRARRAHLAEALVAANPQAFAEGVRHLEPGTVLTVPASKRAHATAPADAVPRMVSHARTNATPAASTAAGPAANATTPASAAPTPVRERASVPSDSAALAALTQRVDALEKALAQASETQVREHAELLALREEVADAAIEARLHSRDGSTPATREATAVPAESQPAPPVDDSEPALPAYVAPPAPSAQASASAADEPATPTRYARLRARLGAIAALALLMLIAFYGLRAVLRRRALKAALDELESDARGRARDDVVHVGGGDQHDALWMSAHGTTDTDATGPPGHEHAGEPEPHIDVDSVPTKYDMDTSYLSALEEDIATGEAMAPAAGAPDAHPDADARAAPHDHVAGLPHESAIESTIIRQLEDKDISPDMLILEPDFTSTDMELTSRRYDHTSDNERRSNGTDALKDALRVAITREPDRIDLRVKLLEVYYATAIANNLAFYELASALSRERELLPAEEHVRIAAMQRAIAAAPARQAEVAASDDLADCA